MADYDSRPDTWEHIAEVQRRLDVIVRELQQRAYAHDGSKLLAPEREIFDRFTPWLGKQTYGSPEYEATRRQMGAALDHHYAHNDHHPEYHANGIADMDLMQVTEMLADWKAASMRHADGDLARSIEHNARRFGYGEEMARLLTNTARNLGWL